MMNFWPNLPGALLLAWINSNPSTSKYTNGNNYEITYTSLYWGEFDRYLLVPVMSSIAKSSTVDFYNPLPN